MMFSGSDGGWLSTHPKLTARIEAITMHGGMLPGEVHVTQPRVAVAPPRPGQAPTFGRRGQPQGLGRAPRLSGPMAQRSFVHKSTPHAVWDDKLPPPPSRGDAWGSGTPQPTVWEQIQMEGWPDYLKKRPLLYVPFVVAAALLLPACRAFHVCARLPLGHASSSGEPMLRVNGLFGHIQRNNAKTLVLMALFLLLVEGTQVALRMMPTAMITNINGQLPPWPAGSSMVEHHPNGTFSSKRSAKPEAIAATPDRPALAAAPAERNGAPVAKGREGRPDRRHSR